MGIKLIDESWGTLIQCSGSSLELSLNWDKLPGFDLNHSYCLVKITPFDKLIPSQYIRPNSSGPFFLYLREGVSYQISLFVVPVLKYEVESDLIPFPWVDLIQDHDNLYSLVWANIEIDKFLRNNQKQKIVISADGEIIEERDPEKEPLVRINKRVQQISLVLQDGKKLFSLKTNLWQKREIAAAEFVIPARKVELNLSTIIKTTPNWQVRAEIPFFHQMHKKWETVFGKFFSDQEKDKGRLVGSICFIEDDVVTKQFRLFGYGITLPEQLLAKKNSIFELQLQITSPHREFFQQSLFKKRYENPDSHLFFTDSDISQAQEELFSINKYVCWEQSLLQLVLYSISAEGEWQEEIRETAQMFRWEYVPQESTHKIKAQWLLSDDGNEKKEIVCLESISLTRNFFPTKVVLKPFNGYHLLAWWDIDQKGVEKFLMNQWQKPSAEVNFYLKVNEEYLGQRIHRSDLDIHLTDLFSPHKNIYFPIEGGKSYNAEIVARYQEQELALTPISQAIMTPRNSNGETSDQYHYAKHITTNFHPSQREVGHQNGSDFANRAKVLFHLHMHSPNLFRAEPFRESFIRDINWPYRDDSGTEIYNTPGEWVYKNCMESWLPLLRIFRKLAAEGVDYQLSIDITPPVAYMLNSPRFKDYMSRYLLRVQANIKTQIAIMKAKRNDPQFIYAAQSYQREIDSIANFYNHELKKEVIAAFVDLENNGYLEISTCTATHGMAAELESTPHALDAQIVLAARSHHRLFQKRVNGIWLAENSFFPGVEKVLQKENLQYFFCEAEAVLQGSAKIREEEFSPVVLPGSGVTAFGRSRMGRLQIWDAESGYAGHPDFREYHFRHYGLPLKKITSKQSNEKQPYNFKRAETVAQEQARDFYRKLTDKVNSFDLNIFKNTPLITCSYDAELFGHHWAEGPIFLEELLREFFRSGDKIGLTTPSHYLINNLNLPEITPNPSSWGHETTHILWSDPKVAWTQRELERADELLKIYLKHSQEGKFNDFQIRAAKQMGAELIRAQSSDLTFVIMAGAFEEDMRREILKYLDYFYRLKSLIDNDKEDEGFLTFRKYENDMFPEMEDYYN